MIRRCNTLGKFRSKSWFWSRSWSGSWFRWERSSWSESWTGSIRWSRWLGDFNGYRL